jgi:catechol 2,3-dioxygenase-like lactoylglutathione lyase family enzyme
MKFEELNHVALEVKDLEASVNFYQTALRLELIPRPAFSFPGAWFRLGESQELHLIGGSATEGKMRSRQNHFALLTEELDSWEEHFRVNAVEHLPRKLRPDGAEQIFLADPDGHFVELCTRPALPSDAH